MRSVLSLPFALSLLAAASPALAAQRQIVVDAAGGGDFLSLAPAVAAALAGDTIVVRAGEYREPALDIDKGIAIVGLVGVRLIGNTILPPYLRVHDIPARQTFAMRGFTAVGPFDGSYTIDVQSCRGTVSLQAMQGLLAHLDIDCVSCSQVEMKNLTVAHLSVNDSNVVVQRSAFENLGSPIVGSGELGLVRCSVTVQPGFFSSGPGLRWTSGRLTLTRSNVSAAQSGSAPAPAVQVDSGTVVVDPTTVLVPWMGAPPIGGAATVQSREVASLVADSSGTLLDVDLHGLRTSDYVVLLSRPTPILPTFAGAVWVSTDEHLVVAFGSFGSTRNATHRLAHAAVPAGFTTTLQAVFFTDRLSVSTASIVVFP
ncbi:MAG: hypothetical protein R3F56_23475 [Planctomycetota bacterium]